MAVIHDISINGSGTSGGGTFKKVTIRGEGTITDPLTCETFRSYGTSTIEADLKSERASIFGESKIDGALDTTSLKVLGQLKVGRALHCHALKVRGSLELGEGYKGEMADIKGELITEREVELEALLLVGTIRVSGLLNSGSIDLQLKFDDSRIKEMGGDTITVKRKVGPLPFGKSLGILHVEVIEGDDLNLEFTKAGVVRGKRITLGKGCEIGLVEYTENLKELNQPTIKEKRKL